MNLIDYQNQSFLEEYEELSRVKNPSLDNLLRKSPCIILIGILTV